MSRKVFLRKTSIILRCGKWVGTEGVKKGKFERKKETQKRLGPQQKISSTRHMAHTCNPSYLRS
jgi:hypothetical protein